MAVTTRALTAPTQRRHALSNIAYASNGPSLLLRDRRTFLRGTARTLQFCADWADIVATGGTPAWTSVATFAESTSYTIAWMHELANGELIACLTRTDITPPVSHLWRSSGWPANPATATWTQVLSSQGGRFDQQYSSHAWASGGNGVVVCAESGAQTSGGAANDTVDQSRATRAFLSLDFGATWVQLLELRAFAAAQGVPYPAGVHLHGIAYDEEWNRIWINYGDDTGDGLKIAGAGYTQTLFSDDRGATWQKLAMPAGWANTNAALGYGQWIAFAFTPAGVILSPDVSKPLGPVLYRRSGYRQIGAAQWLLPGSGVNGRVARLGSGYAVTGSTGRTYGAGTANMPVAISDDGLAWDIVTVPVTTGASGYGPTIGYVLGPTMSGRVVLGLGGASLAGGNGWAVATLG